MLKPSTLHAPLVFETDLSEEDVLGSPMCINGMKLLRHTKEMNGIPLTKTYGNFNRKCVEWAAAEFRWPGFEQAELYAVNKVLNEPDFPPIFAMHQALLDARLMRHRGGKAVLTKAGDRIMGQYGEFQAKLTEWLLVSPMGDGHRANDVFWNLEHMLAVIGNQMGDWETLGDFTEWAVPVDLFPATGTLSSRYEANLFIALNLVRPLCWLGLLEDESGKQPGMPMEKRKYRKTALFDRLIRIVRPLSAAGGTMH